MIKTDITNLEPKKNIIIKSRKEIEEMEKEDDSYAKNYFDKYCEARKSSGLDNSNIKDSFMKYMVEDVDLGF